MKRIINIILIIILALILLRWVTAHAETRPTGCPYGDSIPVDSIKCAPPPELPKTEEVQKSYTPVVEPETPIIVVTDGK